MRLFSEKVEPTFTSSNLNILTVKEFVEVFFDVFEFEINGKKFIAEKVSDYRGFPVVDIPLVLEGKELTAPFVLQKGKFEILFNPDLATIVGEAVEESIDPLIDVTEKAEEIEEIVLEKKETILEEIAQAKQSAVKYVEALKQQKLKEAAEYFDNKQKIFEIELNESKKGLLDEFLGLVENVKSDVFTFNQEEKDKLKTFIESSINHLSSKLSKSIDSKQESAEEKFSEQINELANKVLSGVLLKEIERANEGTKKDVNERFDSISRSLDKLIKSERERTKTELGNILKRHDSSILSLEKINVELHDQIVKSNNKSLSRIGNVKTVLEDTISSTSNKLVDRIESAEKRIKQYYDNKIATIEEKTQHLADETRKAIISLVNESRQSLLDQVAGIKYDVPNIVIEKSNGNKEINLKGLRSELEKTITSRFTTEIQSLKRLIEMSSGGGSVAQQFAEGGTMRGSLTVIGTISAQQYLGMDAIPSTLCDLSGVNCGSSPDIVDLKTQSPTILYQPNPYDTSQWKRANLILTQSPMPPSPVGSYLPLSGGTVTGNVTVVGTLSTTLLEAQSANITVIDIKQYELSGFNVTGDATVQGTVSATGVMYASGGNSSQWNSAYSSVSVLDNRVDSLYSYLVQNFDTNYEVPGNDISQFVTTFWTNIYNVGDVISLSSINTSYLLGNSDGSSVNDWYEINLKPNFLFYKRNLATGSIIDSFPLSSAKSAKYVIQVEDNKTDDMFYGEINVVSNGTIAVASEYGLNHTTLFPFVEFSASVTGGMVNLIASELDTHVMTDFVFKGNRTNMFTH